MPIHMFTVEETAHIAGEGLRLMPGLKLTDEHPEISAMIQGCTLKLVFPDGREQFTRLVTYGLPVIEVDGGFAMEDDPALTLTIPVDVGEVPPGTQVWIGYDGLH